MISPWLSLGIAGVFEVVWAVGLKYTDGFSRLWPSVFTLLAMAVSLYFLAQAIRTIPLGTGYAVWTGIGAAGTAIMGIVLFAESTHVMRLLCIALIVAGIVGLKPSGHGARHPVWITDRPPLILHNTARTREKSAQILA